MWKYLEEEEFHGQLNGGLSLSLSIFQMVPWFIVSSVNGVILLGFIFFPPHSSISSH